MKRRSLISLMAAAPVSSVLTACGGGSLGDGTVKLRLLNASTGYPSLDLFVDDDREVSGAAFGAVTSYASVPDGDVSTTLTRNGSSTSLLAQDRSLENDTRYVVIAYGWEGRLQSVIVTEEEDDADNNETKLSVFNAATDAGPLDIYLTTDDEPLDEATPVASGVAGAADPTAFTKVDAGIYRLRITAADDSDDLRLDIGGVVLSSKKVMTLVVTPGASGVLVNAMTLVQEGAVTTYNNTSARLRVVAATTDNAVVSATANGVALGATARSSSIGSYALMAAGTAVVLAVTVNGATQTSTVALAAGTDVTLLVYGEASAASVQVMTDDNRLPTDSNKFKVRLVHALARLDANLTLTLDFSAVAADVVYGTSSAFSSQTASDQMQLAVTSPLSTTPLYSATDITLVPNSVYTFFMMGSADASPAGVLRLDRAAPGTVDDTEEPAT